METVGESGRITRVRRTLQSARDPVQGAFFWLALFYFVYCARPEDWPPGLKIHSLGKNYSLRRYFLALFERRKNHAPHSRLTQGRALLISSCMFPDSSVVGVADMERRSSGYFGGFCESCSRLGFDISAGHKLRKIAPDTFYPSRIGCRDRDCLDCQGSQHTPTRRRPWRHLR
jgi:hypothetical protein